MGIELIIKKMRYYFLCSYMRRSFTPPYNEYKVVRCFNTIEEVHSFMIQLDNEFGFCIAKWL